MARPKDPAVRTLLVERAAHMLRTREPITLRSLVAGTGVSTMAVYTHFAGMDGVWSALRQEGFTRLAGWLATVEPTTDPVRDLAALLAAYLRNALDHPDLYRVMFDASFPLEDPDAAEATLLVLVAAAERGVEAGRYRPDVDPLELATESWATCHGLVSLVTPGPLPRTRLDLGVRMLTALYVAAGDEPERCRASVADGWGGLLQAGGRPIGAAQPPAQPRSST
ncbi:TetR/AcrR family transcriptional regulator [Patulibacter americanus]|uniref:TetR/AcrR family transcriptional regulator n=1 Tax=Patulibacter americanus TaxID=588672 RepID=UPI0003B5F02D|nr:TetR/AcrR family transcriptional regulator [Patulibacter americanus]